NRNPHRPERCPEATVSLGEQCECATGQGGHGEYAHVPEAVFCRERAFDQVKLADRPAVAALEHPVRGAIIVAQCQHAGHWRRVVVTLPQSRTYWQWCVHASNSVRKGG